MNIERAKSIIAALADGIDPTTGELLPDEHVCCKPEVLRAFYAVLGENTEKAKKYKNSGKPWKPAEDYILRHMFEHGTKKSEIQKYFERSPGSIDARLEKLGLIEEKSHYWQHTK